MTEIAQNPISENKVTVFQLDGQPVRGRAVTLGSALNEALGTRYPDLVSRLLGEAMLISAIVAQSLKFDGRLVIQCHGTNSGAISLLMSDCTTKGHIRGYARWDEASLKELKLDNRNPGAEDLLGGGTFSMTIDQGPERTNIKAWPLSKARASLIAPSITLSNPSKSRLKSILSADNCKNRAKSLSGAAAV